MNLSKNILIFLLLGLSLTSCTITNDIRTFQVEIMKPGIFVYPENIDSIAIFKRDIHKSDTCTFEYWKLNEENKYSDPNVKYSFLSNLCVDAVANSLENKGYFKKVTSYQDSLNYLFEGNENDIDPIKLFENTKSDVCIFLDYFHFNSTVINSERDFLNIWLNLSWLIVIKNDTAAYIYNQSDELTFDERDNPDFLKMNPHPNQLLFHATQYLGEYFASRLIPSWLKVERFYYKSNNTSMLEAEKFALTNEWLKAAKIWNDNTKSKNPRIAAKASFNMALACEMEGKLEPGIDWLVKSYSGLKRNNKIHKENCQRYANILALRKKEIEKLEKQVRNPEINSSQF